MGHEITGRLDDLGLDHVDVPIAGTPRSNITLVEADGRTSKVNEPGPRLSTAEADALCAKALSTSGSDEWIVWAGSLPDGFALARLAAAVAEARAAGRRVALDCSGAPLEHVLAQGGGGLPHLVKPNAEELAEVTGRSLRTLGDVADAAQLLLARGVRVVLVSLGADGALLVDADLPQPLHGNTSVRRVVNTVGAGDAFLAGWLAALDAGATKVDARECPALRRHGRRARGHAARRARSGPSGRRHARGRAHPTHVTAGRRPSSSSSTPTSTFTCSPPDDSA